jgi:hypothetical protein
MRTLILTLAILVVGVVTIPVAGAGAAPSSAPGYGMAATDALLEAQRLPDVNSEVHTADGGPGESGVQKGAGVRSPGRA